MPPEKDVAELEPDSSTGPTDDTGQQAEPEKVEAQQPDTAESSPATDETKDKSTLSVVRDVVDGRKPKSEAASSAEGVDETGRGPDGKFVTKKEPDNENYSDVPFHKHPRFQEVIRKLHSETADATRYRNVQGFLDQNGLAAEEAANALTIAGLMKTDPKRAWEQLKPAVENLLAAIGEVLPDDLRQRVQAGELPADVAKEISRSRAEVQNAQARQAFEQQRMSQQQVVQQQSSIMEAAAAWEADRRLKDPGFEAKLEPLRDRLGFLFSTEGRPRTAQAARDQLERAYKAINQRVMSAAPVQQKPAVRPIVGGQVAGNARPKFEGTLDVIKDVVARRRA